MEQTEQTEPRWKLVNVRLTTGEHQAIKDAADQAGVGMAALLRNGGLNEVRRLQRLAVGSWAQVQVSYDPNTGGVLVAPLP